MQNAPKIVNNTSIIAIPNTRVCIPFPGIPSIFEYLHKLVFIYNNFRYKMNILKIFYIKIFYIKIFYTLCSI